MAKTMIDAGADLLEIAAPPYSDPVADGPRDRAGARPRPPGRDDHGRRLRPRPTGQGACAGNAPLVLFTYHNIIHRRGADRFFAEAAASGADGVLIVDLPAEESDEVAPLRRPARRRPDRPHRPDDVAGTAAYHPQGRLRVRLPDLARGGVTGERDRLPP
ncbi:tryptophan synthase subunit alpha, partial [Methanoculleus chikugoensis]|uniref:tryptophan synthase subunit alpha n=1 Tax=Methanoculleus chikugoensis TaxID=118126 RepID=UPI001FB46B93